MIFDPLQPYRFPLVNFDTDDASGKSTNDDDPEKKGGKKKDDDDNDEEKISLTKTELQKRIDDVVKDRLEREQRKREIAEQKAREDAEAKSLADQKKFEELAVKHAARIEELEKNVADAAALQETVDRYRDALSKTLDTQKKGLPAHVLTLLEKLDPVDQLEYIAENADAFKTKKSAPDPTLDADPDALSEEQKTAASAATNRFYQSNI